MSFSGVSFMSAAQTQNAHIIVHKITSDKKKTTLKIMFNLFSVFFGMEMYHTPNLDIKNGLNNSIQNQMQDGLKLFSITLFKICVIMGMGTIHYKQL